MGREEIEKYFEDVLNTFVDEFLLGKVANNDSGNKDCQKLLHLFAAIFFYTA